MAFPEVKAYLLEEGNPNNFSVSKKILCKAFSFVKVCCKLHIISKYLILVLYFYFQNVYLPIECVIVNFGFMSFVFFCWLEVLQNKICRLTDVSVALFFYAKSLNNRSKQTTTTQIRFYNCLNSFVGVQRKNDWHSPGCHQCNHEKVSTCQFRGAFCKSWTLHICM